MQVLSHLIIFLLAAGVIWFFAGLLIEAVDRVARRFNRSGFTTAFFLLGFLTSISEISVAVNSSLKNVPQISVGNLVGASFVIPLFVVPLLAILGNGINLKKVISRRNLLFSLIVILLPSLLVLDGNVTQLDGVFALVFYIMLAVVISHKKTVLQASKAVGEELAEKHSPSDYLKILTAAAFIFIAAHFLVNEVVFFSTLFGIPGSLIGLLVLSVGTNVPELVIAVRSVYKRHKDIAFGDDLGSAVTNTPIFGLLALVNGPFTIVASSFYATFILTFIAFTIFFIFAATRKKISRKEGIILLAFYLTFILVQVYNIIKAVN